MKLPLLRHRVLRNRHPNNRTSGVDHPAASGSGPRIPGRRSRRLWRRLGLCLLFASNLQQHLVQFTVRSTGGPAHYDGKEIKATHAAMRVNNPEFDAVLGDLKASLDRLQIPNKEQKELLSIIENTRPQIVTQRVIAQE